MADDDGILYIDSIKDGADIVGECIEIVTVAGIIRAPMTAPVERHATPTPLGKANPGGCPTSRSRAPMVPQRLSGGRFPSPESES